MAERTRDQGNLLQIEQHDRPVMGPKAEQDCESQKYKENRNTNFPPPKGIEPSCSRKSCGTYPLWSRSIPEVSVFVEELERSHIIICWKAQVHSIRQSPFILRVFDGGSKLFR